MINRASRFFYITVLGLFLLTTLLVGCTPAKNDATQEELVIKLERGACFGDCPVYSLTIFGNGTVVYDGKDFVQTKGARETAISTGAVNELVSEFEKADYFSLNDSYTQFGVSDMPYVTTSIHIGGKTKTISHYLGDRSAPAQLTELENRIDEIVNSDQWIK
jgi:hypothetical protein